MNDDADYKHFSRIVAPLLAGFTLPTIAVIVMTPAQDLNFARYQILCLLLASTGLLLASVQLSVGRLFKNASPWNEIRAFLTFSGLVCLSVGLALLAASQLKADNGALMTALAIFAAGVLVPIGMNVGYWIADHVRDTLHDSYKAQLDAAQAGEQAERARAERAEAQLKAERAKRRGLISGNGHEQPATQR